MRTYFPFAFEAHLNFLTNDLEGKLTVHPRDDGVFQTFICSEPITGLGTHLMRTMSAGPYCTLDRKRQVTDKGFGE